jgi:hypothetical protein
MVQMLAAFLAAVGEACAALSGPCAPIPGRDAPPPIAAAASPGSDGAAAARNALDREAVAMLQQAQRAGSVHGYDRPWQDGGWLHAGPGKVGRLYDLCTGAVEPRPTLSRGSWTWETLDPRAVSAADRRALLDWRAQQVIAQYSCGSVFVIGSLAADARRKFTVCPLQSTKGTAEIEAFIAYVQRRPTKRRADALTETLVDALREAGCS